MPTHANTRAPIPDDLIRRGLVGPRRRRRRNARPGRRQARVHVGHLGGGGALALQFIACVHACVRVCVRTCVSVHSRVCVRVYIGGAGLPASPCPPRGPCGAASWRPGPPPHTTQTSPTHPHPPTHTRRRRHHHHHHHPHTQNHPPTHPTHAARPTSFASVGATQRPRWGVGQPRTWGVVMWRMMMRTCWGPRAWGGGGGGRWQKRGSGVFTPPQKTLSHTHTAHCPMRRALPPCSS